MTITAPRVDVARTATPEPVIVRPALPRSATSLILSLSIAASLMPSLLPRSATTQAVVTGLFAAAGLLASALTHRATRRIHPTRPNPGLRRWAAAGATVIVIAAGVAAARWQSGLRDAMGVEQVDALHWPQVLCGSVSVCSALVVVGLAVSRGLRRLGTGHTVAVALVLGFVAYPLAASPLVRSTASADTVVGADRLGTEGTRFATGGTDPTAIRTYVGLHMAADDDSRAAVAVDELRRAGGFGKSHIVLAVPTGSGWVDENAVRGMEERFGGDVATVAAQYSDRPSWVTYVFTPNAATNSAVAMLRALTSALSEMPSDIRPELYVYGQSLGSIGGSSAVHGDSAGVCGALWAGPPAGDVAPTGNTVVLANISDPVVWWSSDLITSPPDLATARVDSPVPDWIPMVSYLQTTVDLMSALSTPAGHGHRYGSDQGTSLPDCG